MPEQLYWNTVDPLLQDALVKIMEDDLFQSFRLVGGTSLSLQLGHRMSVDIDLFTDAPYGSVDFDEIDKFLRSTFPYVSEAKAGVIGMGTSYQIGDTVQSSVKLDLYYTDTFIQEPLEMDNVRMATVEEIIAMKVDIVQRGGRKKDFWDLHEVMEDYTIPQMISLHESRHPHTHEEQTILKNFTEFEDADGDFDPICLRGKHWELIKLDVSEAIEKL